MAQPLGFPSPGHGVKNPSWVWLKSQMRSSSWWKTMVSCTNATCFCEVHRALSALGEAEMKETWSLPVERPPSLLRTVDPQQDMSLSKGWAGGVMLWAKYRMMETQVTLWCHSFYHSDNWEPASLFRGENEKAQRGNLLLVERVIPIFLLNLVIGCKSFFIVLLLVSCSCKWTE